MSSHERESEEGEEEREVCDLKKDSADQCVGDK